MRLCNGEQMSYEEKRTVLQKIGLGLPLDGKGVGPNVARSAEDWNDFRKFHKKHNPFRYFINMTLSQSSFGLGLCLCNEQKNGFNIELQDDITLSIRVWSQDMLI